MTLDDLELLFTSSDFLGILRYFAFLGGLYYIPRLLRAQKLTDHD